MSVNDSTYTVVVYSVPDEDIICNFILGRTLFHTNAELRITPGIVEIKKISSDIQKIMAIETNYNELHIEYREHSSVINSMI